ncbi:hypothetical protein Pcinc_034550 [Petrolisthes cinctipes]|uniref:Kinesin motor domain-containing protein n=1 Tax=Petrolisthes cinctipes TaxID=88211 RepID=A0AAE1EQ21_PETCI|nr:hypothetical protein Pcinc_034550 [Petrolisthes cinctipes]
MGEESDKVIPVRVAVRLRPLNTKELREGCQECIEITNDSPQVVVTGTDKAFTYDYAYPADSSQGYVYETAVKNVVKNLFKGYNVTVLAYGQTGTGKTHTMGTTYTREDDVEPGIIPRAVKDIFDGVAEQNECEYMVKVSFIELYKENLFDLLNNKSRDECSVDIREDPKCGIKIVGLTEIPVTSLEETMRCLEHGAMNRATGATAMNAHSSRSHAIFSLHIQQRNSKKEENIVCSKFHMVDLAGSERAKKTGATGVRFKEGVNINKGLLALGNVIAALCEEGSRGHIPYRDSKLTRLLQDSLGGNSHTVMVACVSPADSNLEETLTTLRYADRARKIKNKPIINRDPQAAELARLRQQLLQLQVQLLASGTSDGKGQAAPSNTEVSALLSRNKAMEEEIEQLARALQSAIDENTNMAEKALMAEMSRDRMKVKLEELLAQTGNTYEALNKTLDVTVNPQYEDQLNLVKELQTKIVELQSEQHRGEKAMMDLEISRHSTTTNTQADVPTDTVKMEDGNTEDVNTSNEGSPEKETKQFGTEFTLRQAKLNEELQGLNKALAMKEELMSKMSVNDAQFVVMKSKYEKEKRDMEAHIDHLSKEKDELMQQLKVVSTGAAGNKLSEQRRKRVQELESEISGLKQKQKEQQKLLRMKEQSEAKVNKLNSEIQGMKATRVKLIRQMKEDSEKFREWKAKKDREVAKLKQADRQKQYKIVKMESLHSKQQNVLRRKMEEAVAINKRLKDAMAVQKAGAEKRAATRDLGSTTSRIRSWLESELDVVSVTKQAKQSLQTLVEDRKTISDQITKTERQLKKTDISPERESELEAKVSSLENELKMRTAQINDLQAKIVHDDEDAANKKRFESMQSMVEAKCALNYLFRVATDNQVTIATQAADNRDIQAQYDEVTHSLEELEADLRMLKKNHQAELTKLEQDHEEKVLYLLGQMPKAEPVTQNEEEKLSSLRERLLFQEAEISRLGSLHDQLQTTTQECEDLKKQLSVSIANGGCQVLPMPSLGHEGRRRTYIKPKASTKQQMKNLEPTFSESEEDIDDDQSQKDDPDWRQTPLFKKISKITQSHKSYNEEDEEFEEEILGPKNKKLSVVKRDSNGEVKCGCKGDCTKRLCNCQKNGNACNIKCKCNVIKCKNRPSTPDYSLSDSSKGDSLLSSTFEVSNLPLQENIKRPRLQPMGSLLGGASGPYTTNTTNTITENASPSLF